MQIEMPEDVSEQAFQDMMKLIPESAEFVRSYLPKSYAYPPPWWREFEFQLTEPYKDASKVGDRIIFSCVLKLKERS